MKHLAEALQDPAQPVQLAALRAAAELLDGVAEGELRGDVLRGACFGQESSSVEARRHAYKRSRCIRYIRSIHILLIS